MRAIVWPKANTSKSGKNRSDVEMVVLYEHSEGLHLVRGLIDTFDPIGSRAPRWGARLVISIFENDIETKIILQSLGRRR